MNNTIKRLQLEQLAEAGHITWKELAILMMDNSHHGDTDEVYDMFMAKRCTTPSQIISIFKHSPKEETNNAIHNNGRQTSTTSTTMYKCGNVLRSIFGLYGDRLGKYALNCKPTGLPSIPKEPSELPSIPEH